LQLSVWWGCGANSGSANLVRGIVLLERKERVAGRWKHVTLGSTYSKLSTCGIVLKVVLVARWWMIGGYDRICFTPIRIKPKIIIFVKRRGPSWCRWSCMCWWWRNIHRWTIPGCDWISRGIKTEV
jgi:hypothetical protein